MACIGDMMELPNKSQQKIVAVRVCHSVEILGNILSLGSFLPVTTTRSIIYGGDRVSPCRRSFHSLNKLGPFSLSPGICKFDLVCSAINGLSNCLRIQSV